MLDPWPDEPEEVAPESRWDDPERDLPQVPTPDVDEEDVDPEILETFWRSVLLANVALFGLALGPMLVVFRGQWLWGGAAVTLGAVAGLRVYHHYRAFERRHGDSEEPRSSDSEEPRSSGRRTQSVDSEASATPRADGNAVDSEEPRSSDSEMSPTPETTGEAGDSRAVPDDSEEPRSSDRRTQSVDNEDAPERNA